MLARRQWHRSVTISKLSELVEDYDGNFGVCLKCGSTTDGVEPDARDYKCDDCGEPHVCGAEEAILMMV